MHAIQQAIEQLCFGLSFFLLLLHFVLSVLLTPTSSSSWSCVFFTTVLKPIHTHRERERNRKRTLHRNYNVFWPNADNENEYTMQIGKRQSLFNPETFNSNTQFFSLQLKFQRERYITLVDCSHQMGVEELFASYESFQHDSILFCFGFHCVLCNYVYSSQKRRK